MRPFAPFCPAVTTTSGRFAPRHPRKCRVWLSLCGSIPTQSLCSGRWFFAKQSDFVDESAIQVEPGISLKCFKSLPLRKPPARGRGRCGGTGCARILVITLNSPAPLPKRETALFVALIRMYRVPGPYSTVPLRVSDCLLRSRRSPLRLSFLSEVGFLKHCPLSSAVCVGAFAVRALFQWWSASWWNALQFMVSQSPRKGLTQYDTADIVLAIVVSTDTPGATALAFADYIIGREQPCPWW